MSQIKFISGIVVDVGTVEESLDESGPNKKSKGLLSKFFKSED